MKRLTLLLTISLFSLLNYGQTLTIPTSEVLLTDTNSFGSNMYLLFTNWTISSQLISTGTANGNSIYKITTSFAPNNTDLNDIITNGGNIENWQFYFKVSDSTFFTEKVPSEDTLSGNIYSVKGKNTNELKDWGSYFDESFEMYYNTYNGQYIIPARDDLGHKLDLKTVIKIRNKYSQVIGYYTPYTLSQVTQSNLIERAAW